MKKSITLIFALFFAVAVFGQNRNIELLNGRSMANCFGTGYELGKTTKDTVTVPILCPKMGAAQMAAFEIAYNRPDPNRGILLLAYAMQERTFEKKWVWEFQTKDGYTGYDQLVEKEIQIASRYLDPIEGCYQLTPLTND